MAKIKYYQIAFKGTGVEQTYIRLVSPNRSKIDSLTAQGYTFKSSVNPLVYIDPILDGTTIRERTDEEKQAVIDYKFSLQVSNLSNCTKLELYDAMKDDMIEVFSTFEVLPEYDKTNDFNFNHQTIKDEMAKLETGVLQAIKARIIQNRSV